MRLIFPLLLLGAVLFAAPSTYNILKLPPGATLTMDGTLDPATEWNDAYFIDSLRSQNNLYASDVPPWTSANFQMMVYGAWDSGRVYFAVRVIHDNVYNNCGYGETTGRCGCDNIKVNPGGRSAGFYIMSDGQIQFNPSCPFGPTTIQGNCNSSGGAGGTLPSYEFFLDLATLDPLGTGTFQLYLGSEDQDGLIGSCSNETWVCIGMEYTGPKNWSSSQWDNTLYYPTYYLDSTVGPSLSVESKPLRNISSVRLSASPNPFMPATVLSYSALHAGTLQIYDVTGKVVWSFATKPGSADVLWNGADLHGKNLSAGLYLARLTSGSEVRSARLFLMK